jgi:hypothetical protein
MRCRGQASREKGKGEKEITGEAAREYCTIDKIEERRAREQQGKQGQEGPGKHGTLDREEGQKEMYRGEGEQGIVDCISRP